MPAAWVSRALNAWAGMFRRPCGSTAAKLLPSRLAPWLRWQGLQGRLQEERQELAHLLARQQQRLLQPGGSYRLVPVAFMAAWRAYMGQAGKRALGKGATAAAVSRDGRHFVWHSAAGPPDAALPAWEACARGQHGL